MAEITSVSFTSPENILYHLSGKVIHGRGIGKLVGTPTADIQVSPTQKLPPVGVYITTLCWHSHKYASVTNIGNRPTIDNDTRISVETLILDFNTDIYDAQVDIELLEFLRLPQKFQTLSELREQVFNDCDRARKYFRTLSQKIPLSQNIISPDCIRIGSLCIDPLKRCVTVRNHDISLTTKEFDLLLFLCQHPGWAYSKEQLYEEVWHEPSNGVYHPVENLVCQLRKKLKSNGYENESCIKTIIGYGYKFLL